MLPHHYRCWYLHLCTNFKQNKWNSKFRGWGMRNTCLGIENRAQCWWLKHARGHSCQAGTGFLHQSRKVWIVSDSCFRTSPQKFILGISSNLLARERPGAWGRRAGLAEASTCLWGSPGQLHHLPNSETAAQCMACLCSCQQAPSGPRKAYREKQCCSLCHIFLSPPFTTRMQISHSFSKWLHKHHINFVHISPKKSANC